MWGCTGGEADRSRNSSASDLKADPTAPANQIRWKFAGGTNLDPAKDTHMHGATVTFVDDDHIEIAGEAWENGKPSPDHCGTMKLVRKK